jgi:polymorphic toxin system nucleotidyltransferase-like protein
MRRRESGQPIDIEPYRENLVRYLEGLDGLVAAWIYGDPDLAFLFRPDRVPDLSREGQLYLALAGTLHQEDFSLVSLNRAPILLQFRVLETGRQLVCRDAVARADFVERVIFRHSDFAVLGPKLAEEFGEAVLKGWRYED